LRQVVDGDEAASTVREPGPDPEETGWPTPSARIGVSLPRAAALTDALLEPVGCAVSSSDFQDLRGLLLRELPRLADELPPNQRLEIGTYELAVARDHPELCSTRSEAFSPSPVRCRRAIGVAAVERCVRGRSSAPSKAVSEVLAHGVEDLAVEVSEHGGARPPWWAEWYAGLPLGGKVLVQAEAVTWATQLWTALDWCRFVRPPVIGGRDDWWDCPGTRRLVVRGRAEVRAWAGTRPAMLVVATGFPGPCWRAELAHRALVIALARGERSMPARVVGLWPASGLVRICEVDVAALSEAAAALVSAVGRWVEALVASSQVDPVPS